MRAAINEALKGAMKAGDKRRLSTVRMMMAAIKDRDIDARAPISDADILSLLQKLIKSREESAGLYDKGERPELAAQEREEIGIIRTFMPEPMDEAETEAAIRGAIAETGATSVKDMGRVIGLLRARHAGRMDFGRASGRVKAALSG